MNYSKLLRFILIALLITDAFRIISSAGKLDVNNATYLAAFLNYISIAILIRISYKEGFGNNNIPRSIQNAIKLWLLCIIFNLMRGVFFATDYWDWKFLLLSSLPFSFIPLVFFLGKNLTIDKLFFKIVLKYLFLFGFLLIPLTLVTSDELYSRLMIPVSLFILFIPFVQPKWKLLIIIVAVTSSLLVVDFRSNIIKNVFSILLLLVYYFRNYISTNWLRVAHLSLFLIPILLLISATTGNYNIFEELSNNDDYNIIDSEGNDESLTADTRTLLYVEAFSNLHSTGNWLIGKSAVGSYQSELFEDDGGAINGKRYGSEVGILNILFYYGIVGVACYFLLLFIVSYVALNHSSNILAKMLSLFIAFRWFYSFVEEFSQFDMNFFFVWLAIGMASAASFRNMNDKEITRYFELR